MFKKSNTRKQMDFFKDVSALLSSRKKKLLESSTAWHNIFYSEVVSQIDEEVFSLLYDESKGRPNAPLRVLVGMMILKEGNGWSDEQLFEECRFNMKAMRALGLINIDDDVPAESTYYEFRKLLGNHIEATEEDLIKTSFINVTTKQLIKHGIKGEKIRLDSKLINSNIAKSNRLDLIVEAARKFITIIETGPARKHFGAKMYELLKKLKGQSTSNFTYPLTGEEKKEMLVTMGKLIQKLLSIFAGSNEKYYRILKQVYEEQYKEVEVDVGEGKGKNDPKETITTEKAVAPKSPKEISSDSIQSIHDPEAAYRTKGEGASKQTVSGYHTNITETCDPDDDLNLIVDVETVPANISEDKFLTESVDAVQAILNEERGNERSLKEVITDGGYDSKTNREEMLKEGRPKWSVAKMKGGRHKYKMRYGEQGELEVYDKNTNERLDVIFSQKANKYVIKKKGKSNRYFTEEEIDSYMKHQTISSQVDPKSYNLRANVESTIHQTFHRLKKRNKIVYRGLIKSQWYALSRAFWVNMVRINKKELKEALFFLFFALKSLLMGRAKKIRHWNEVKNNIPVNIGYETKIQKANNRSGLNYHYLKMK